jgi:hypothetical protein
MHPAQGNPADQFKSEFLPGSVEELEEGSNSEIEGRTLNYDS